MIRLNVASIGMVEDTGSVILVLRSQEEHEQMLVMEVGLLEGRAIAMEAEGIRAPRPLTHDLLLHIIEQLGANVAEVQIRDFRDKTFFADLVLKPVTGSQITVDARPSDAIAIALRSGAPIYTTEQVLATAGVTPEVDEAMEAEKEEDEDEDEANIVH